MHKKRIIEVTGIGALSIAGLSACGDSSEQAAPVTQTVATPVEVTATQTVETGPAVLAAPPLSSELPAAVTGYSDEARAEMVDDGVMEADVEAALHSARNGEAEVEWDDGIWEIEWQDIEIGINPGGVVFEADR